MKVLFKDIGRDKKSWEKQMYPDADLIAKEASKALASRDVEASFDEDSLVAGDIIVGGMRFVGRFEVVND